jgi:hypothetical protein
LDNLDACPGDRLAIFLGQRQQNQSATGTQHPERIDCVSKASATAVTGLAIRIPVGSKIKIRPPAAHQRAPPGTWAEAKNTSKSAIRIR